MVLKITDNMRRIIADGVAEAADKLSPLESIDGKVYLKFDAIDVEKFEGFWIFKFHWLGKVTYTQRVDGGGSNLTIAAIEGRSLVRIG